MKLNAVRHFVIVFITVQFIRGLIGFSNRWFSSDFTWFKFVVDLAMYAAVFAAVEFIGKAARHRSSPADRAK